MDVSYVVKGNLAKELNFNPKYLALVTMTSDDCPTQKYSALNLMYSPFVSFVQIGEGEGPLF
jgi:hypothetical protein